eukprot:740823-Rhodomonas_salina.1
MQSEAMKHEDETKRIYKIKASDKTNVGEQELAVFNAEMGNGSDGIGDMNLGAHAYNFSGFPMPMFALHGVAPRGRGGSWRGGQRG